MLTVNIPKLPISLPQIYYVDHHNPTVTMTITIITALQLDNHHPTTDRGAHTGHYSVPAHLRGIPPPPRAGSSSLNHRQNEITRTVMVTAQNTATPLLHVCGSFVFVVRSASSDIVSNSAVIITTTSGDRHEADEDGGIALPGMVKFMWLLLLLCCCRLCACCRFCCCYCSPDVVRNCKCCYGETSY